MTTDTTDLPTDAEVEDALDVSPLGRLRAKREQLAGHSGTLTLEVPGYDGELHVRYKYVPFNEAKKRGEIMLKETPKEFHELYGCADTLLLCCDEVLMRDQETHELVPLSRDGTPLRFDKRLAEELGFEAPTARAVVLGVFNNDYAVISQAMRVSRWLQNTTKAVDEGLLGE